MKVKAICVDKNNLSFSTEVEVNYICPHCDENVTGTIYFSGDVTNNRTIIFEDHECHECGEYIDLEIEFY